MQPKTNNVPKTTDERLEEFMRIFGMVALVVIIAFVIFLGASAQTAMDAAQRDCEAAGGHFQHNRNYDTLCLKKDAVLLEK